MARYLLTIRCPEDIKQAVEERMFTTGKAKTDVVLELLRTALGMPSTATNEVSTTSLDERITMLLDNRTTELYKQVNARVEEEIAPVKDALAAMATQWEEYKKERQETYNHWLNETLELGRELERAKQQSPYPDESTIELARESVVEDARAVNSLEDMAQGDIGEVENASVGNMVEDIPALATPSSELVEESKLVTPAPKSQGNKSGKKEFGEVLQRVEENLSLGQKKTAAELEKIIGVTAAGIRARRDTGKLDEWKLELVPNTFPQLFRRI